MLRKMQLPRPIIIIQISQVDKSRCKGVEVQALSGAGKTNSDPAS